MLTTTLRARFDGKALIPLGPVDLPVGTEWDIEVREPAEQSPTGSPAALLRALDDGPHLSPGDAEEFCHAIRAAPSAMR